MQGNQQGHGKECEKSHKSRGKTKKTIFEGSQKMGKDHFVDANKMVSGRERGNGGKGEMGAGRNGGTAKITNGSEFQNNSKTVGQNRSGSRQTEETEKKAIRNGRNRTNASMFSFSGSGRTVRGKEKAPCRGGMTGEFVAAGWIEKTA